MLFAAGDLHGKLASASAEVDVLPLLQFANELHWHGSERALPALEQGGVMQNLLG
jgi:hypothetical protein